MQTADFKPKVKRAEGWEPPRYGVYVSGELVGTPEPWEEALWLANYIGMTNKRVLDLVDKAIGEAQSQELTALARLQEAMREEPPS